MNRRLIFISLVLFILFSGLVMAALDKPILLDDPQLVRNSMSKSYELSSVDLRLPEIEMDIFNERTQNKLVDLASLYGTKETGNIYNLLERDMTEELKEYRLNIEKDEAGNAILLKPLPGVSVNAEYDKYEEEYTIEENANISLSYWMNNRTLLRAEYGRENREWWDIKDIMLENEDSRSEDDDTNNDPGNKIGDSTAGSGEDNTEDSSEDSTGDNTADGIEEDIKEEKSYKQPIEELTFKEERNETSRLGISYKTSDYLTLSADYINDFASINSDYSTVFGVEYRDDIGSLKYHYQLDHGDERAKETGLEFGYRDLATFNARYKIYNPKTIEEQLNKWDNQWDFGIDLNLNDISTLTFEYQLKERLIEDLTEDLEDEESNIKAQLKVKF